MRIRPDQIVALREGARRARTHAMAKKLINAFPDQCRTYEPDSLDNFIDQGFEDAQSLDISEFDDVYLYLSLGFLPPKQQQDPFIQAVIIRVLNNRQIPGRDRLEFLFKQIALRNPK